ncbi:MAG TPA: hypothetical protein VFC67_23815 [Prolixibacteraceae bacterium]|nr:hypothetical protein [Prolixibacteraceae bacterium]
MREPCKNTPAAEKGKIILSQIKKVIDTHFPELLNSSNNLSDSRKRKEYSMSEIVTGALFMYIFKETSRNGYNNDRRESCFRKKIFNYFKINLPHGDAYDDVLRVLPPGELESLKTQLVASLIEQKMFREFRFLGKFHLVAVDATGMATFEHKHCDHCLTKTSKTGVVWSLISIMSLRQKLLLPLGCLFHWLQNLLKTIRDVITKNRTANGRLSSDWLQKSKNTFPAYLYVF